MPFRYRPHMTRPYLDVTREDMEIFKRLRCFDLTSAEYVETADWVKMEIALRNKRRARTGWEG